MYTTVISDLDGTLLNGEHRISDFTRSTLQTLVEKGVRFIVATGRHMTDVQGIRASLGFDCDLITSNGALAADASGKEHFDHTLSPEIARWLIAATHEDKRFDTNVYTRESWYVNRIKPELRAFHAESGFSCTVADLQRMDQSRINKIFFVGAHEVLAELEVRLKSQCGADASITFSLPTCLEVMAANVNKGNAAREILEHHGASLDQAIAFGDGMNDYEMLTMASRGYVMANASQRLKQALPGHARAGHCDEDGVAHTLARLFGL
ncbi:Cof-type HAD-IIB family hydrolase [Niveibacterium terrae]|uniref:Cof-type HAD-IIB family hydrolase n=1 Tax=Niveibacterium terrae TaxID=3373598 RepID=UPI003A8FED2D